MPNAIAYMVLGLWPFVMWGIFRALPPGRALVWSVILSYLLLPGYPTAFDFPLMPAFDKVSIPNVMALILAASYYDKEIKWLPESKLGKALVLLFVLAPIPTVLTNAEPVVFATEALRGLYAQDIFAMIVTQCIILANFTLARQLLTSEEDHRHLLWALMVAGVAYAFPMLIEVRLSPQINIWVYGFFQHSFEQMMRGDGFRPIVFLSHGIWAAMFAMTSLCATLVLLMTSPSDKRPRLMFAALFLAAVLVLSKTLAAFLYGTAFAAALFFFGWRTHVKLAAVLATLALAYPVAKGLNLVPEERILALASSVSEDRAQSLEFRFQHEGDLLERAQQKPLFGWGIWGRNQIHDPVTGRITSVSDGRWVLALGIMGWLGFITEFGLLTLPIFLLFRATILKPKPSASGSRMRHVNTKHHVGLSDDETTLKIAAALSLILAINVVDLLPNATLTPLTWLIAGALLGYVEVPKVFKKQQDEIVADKDLPGSGRPNWLLGS